MPRYYVQEATGTMLGASYMINGPWKTIDIIDIPEGRAAFWRIHDAYAIVRKPYANKNVRRITPNKDS